MIGDGREIPCFLKEAASIVAQVLARAGSLSKDNENIEKTVFTVDYSEGITASCVPQTEMGL